MNQKISPCDDFYAYACNKWHIHNPAQFNGNINTNQFQELAKGIERKLFNLLQKKKTGNDNELDQIKDFYESCLETQTETEKYRLALKNLYKEIGEFSTFKSEQQLKETNFKWWTTVANIQKKYGKSIILSQHSLGDNKENLNETKIYLGPPRDMLHNIQEKFIQKYMQSHLDIVPEDALIMAKKALTFENKLTFLKADELYGQDLEEALVPYNTQDLVEKYQHLFDLREYLEIVLDTKDLPEKIYIHNESYFDGLYDVFNSTELEVVEDYILWIFLEEFLLDSSSGHLKNECMSKTKTYFGNYLDHILYKQYHSEATESAIYEIWEDIKTIFKHNLENDRYYWLQNSTRDEALLKLKNMNLAIISYDQENFTEIFENLHIRRFNYVENIQNLLQHAHALRENQFLSYTPVYNVLENLIKIPISILQPRLIWDTYYPKAMQYGSLGYLIAHEMIHGFDDEGRKYDASGNLQEWWDQKSIYEFESRHKCFEDQNLKYNYGFKSLPKFVINGGLNIAYDAYKLWLSRQSETLNQAELEASESLPRLPLNYQKLFFLSFSQLWCEDIHFLVGGSFFNGGIPAPGMFRVISSLSNSREFSWEFKCDINSKMNPAMKCEIY
ncbi:endothelin-converting enzyme 2-like [Cochliomyia hominivorax]